MKNAMKIILTVALCAALAAGTAFLTYRQTMHSLHIEIAGKTAYVTVWNQTDEYIIGE